MESLILALFVWGGIWGIIGALIADRKGWAPVGAFGLCLVFGIFGLAYLATREDIPRYMRESADAPTWEETVRPRPAVADELAKFADLRDRGAITDAEFEAAKRQLLRP